MHSFYRNRFSFQIYTSCNLIIDTSHWNLKIHLLYSYYKRTPELDSNEIILSLTKEMIYLIQTFCSVFVLQVFLWVSICFLWVFLGCYFQGGVFLVGIYLFLIGIYLFLICIYLFLICVYLFLMDIVLFLIGVYFFPMSIYLFLMGIYLFLMGIYLFLMGIYLSRYTPQSNTVQCYAGMLKQVMPHLCT